MANLIDDLLTIIVGTITNVRNTLASGVVTLEDFFYVKIRGLPFIVLGARQTGKTTLIEWLRRNAGSIDDFLPEPTGAGGEVVPDFATRLDENIRLRPSRDVGGEYAMWETDWIELFRTSEPLGIIFMIDHTEPYLHKDALNFVMQMIDDEPKAARNLKAFFIIANKADLWGEEQSLDDLLYYYRNEQKRLSGQAARLDYKWAITGGSLVTGAGIHETMRTFVNLIRPKPREQ